MKKVVFILLTIFSIGNLKAQYNWSNQPIDSIYTLIKEVEKTAGVKLKAITSNKNYYLFADTTRWIQVKVTLKSTKSFEGVKVVESPFFIDYIVIATPTQIGTDLFKNYFSNVATAKKDVGIAYIDTDKFRLRISDAKIVDRNYEKMAGKEIWISEPKK